MEREVGGGIGMGNTCKSMADSFQCMTKPTTIKKKKKTLAPWKKSYDKLRLHIKKPRYHFGNKGPYSLSYDFSSNHVQIGKLDLKEA